MDASSWHGANLPPQRWQHVLTTEQLAELGRVADTLKGCNLATVTDAPLSGSLAELMRLVRSELLSGCGLALLRGMPVVEWGVPRCTAAFYALGLALGSPVPQNAAGHLLGHVRDNGSDPAKPETRLYTTAAAQPWHTDSADLVGLCCLRQSDSGGASRVCCSTAVYAHLVATQPAHAAQLMQPFAWDRKGEIPAGCEPWFPMPVFTTAPGGRVVSMYDRSFITAAQTRLRGAGVPALTASQAAALDSADTAADALAVSMRLQPGDIQWLHSHTTWHARDAFADDAGRSQRHLLRLWLAPPADLAWPLPAGFAVRYGSVAADAQPPRGGIRVPGVVPCAPVEE